MTVVVIICLTGTPSGPGPLAPRDPRVYGLGRPSFLTTPLPTRYAARVPMHPVSSGDSPHRWAAWAEADSNGDSNSSDHGNRQRPASVLAQYQPVLPDNTAGLAFIPVEFEGMQATPYVDSSRCTGEDSNGDSNSNDQRQAAATGNSA